MFFHAVLQPNITDITITPAPNNDSQLLHQFNETVSLTCTAEGGPRIMTRWQFDDGSSVVTEAIDYSSVTYEVTSLSTEHTGVYYCEGIIDGMTDTSMNYTLFGEHIIVVIIWDKTMVENRLSLLKFVETTIVKPFGYILVETSVVIVCLSIASVIADN